MAKLSSCGVVEGLKTCAYGPFVDDFKDRDAENDILTVRHEVDLPAALDELYCKHVSDEQSTLIVVAYQLVAQSRCAALPVGRVAWLHTTSRREPACAATWYVMFLIQPKRKEGISWQYLQKRLK